jgi:diguanylate cyclase (GGDEF)-like protein
MTAAHHRRGALALIVVLVAAAAVFAVHTVVGLGSSVVFDDWLYNAVAGGGALLAIWRGLTSQDERAPWLLIGLGLALWTAGDIWWVINVDTADIPIPSLGDVFYLAMYPPMSIAIVLLIRRRIGRLSTMLALDGLIGAFAVAALSAALVLEPVIENATGSATAMAVTIAYPVYDIVLIAVLVEAIALGGWVLNRGWAVLTAGLVAFAITDSFYYAQIAQGTYVEGGILDNGWIVATLLIGIAAWQPVARQGAARDLGWRELLPPGLFAATAVGVAAYAYAAHLNAFAMGLACAALVAVIARMIATFRENLRILDDAKREALTDALTGLGNRRRLLADLEERLEGGGRHLLVLCDLDGFKHYNDSFGHPAGDALLRRFGSRLAWTIAAHGRAYRMGGDEFCVLLDDNLSAEEATGLVSGALSESGSGFVVTASCGTVALPADAAAPSEALRIGDTRMYEDKGAGRPSPESQSVAMLMRLMAERGDDGAGDGALAAQVAARMGLDAAACEDVRTAAKLHDVGKLAIPDSIVGKPGPLDDDEWAFICRHPLIGQRILQTTPGLAGAAALVRASHERPDGSGYPDRLAGDAIPLGARIVAVFDAYRAMTSERPYRAALAPDAAMRELRRGAGTQFDRAVVAAFEAVLLEAEAASDDLAHDLVGPAADRAEPRVA